MTVELPISLNCNHTLNTKFDKLNSVLNKLEAQLNFQTMTAGWYGDEDDIITIKLMIETESSLVSEEFADCEGLRIDFADDVVCFWQKQENLAHCYVALTTAETELLAQHAKLLNGLLTAKLTKVLNLFAKQLGFSEIL